MEWGLFVKIVNELTSEPLLWLLVWELHNEPLLDKRIFDCVKYFKSKSPGTKCALVTNGELLNRFSLTDIVQSNLDVLTVSLNAHSKEMYESINTGLDYERVVQNVSHLLANDWTKERLVLSFVITDYNKHEVSQAVRYWCKRGVRTRTMGLVNRAGLLDNYQRLRPQRGYYVGSLPLRLWRGFTSQLQRLIGCHLPFFQMNILFNGDVIVCCHDWNRDIVVGNIKVSSLREIWNSERMNEIRRLLLAKRYEQLQPCKGCSLVRRY